MVKKTRMVGYPTVKNINDTFSHFDTIPERHRQTDGQIDRRNCHINSARCIHEPGRAAKTINADVRVKEAVVFALNY